MLKKYALFLCTVLFVFTSCYQSAEHETGSVSFSFARTAIDFEGDFNFVFTLDDGSRNVREISRSLTAEELAELELLEFSFDGIPVGTSVRATLLIEGNLVSDTVEMTVPFYYGEVSSVVRAGKNVLNLELKNQLKPVLNKITFDYDLDEDDESDEGSLFYHLQGDSAVIKLDGDFTVPESYPFVAKSTFGWSNQDNTAIVAFIVPAEAERSEISADLIHAVFSKMQDGFGTQTSWSEALELDGMDTDVKFYIVDKASPSDGSYSGYYKSDTIHSEFTVSEKGKYFAGYAYTYKTPGGLLKVVGPYYKECSVCEFESVGVNYNGKRFADNSIDIAEFSSKEFVITEKWTDGGTEYEIQKSADDYDIYSLHGIEEWQNILGTQTLKFTSDEMQTITTNYEITMKWTWPELKYYLVPTYNYNHHLAVALSSDPYKYVSVAEFDGTDARTYGTVENPNDTFSLYTYSYKWITPSALSSLYNNADVVSPESSLSLTALYNLMSDRMETSFEELGITELTDGVYECTVSAAVTPDSGLGEWLYSEDESESKDYETVSYTADFSSAQITYNNTLFNELKLGYSTGDEAPFELTSDGLNLSATDDEYKFCLGQYVEKDGTAEFEEFEDEDSEYAVKWYVNGKLVSEESTYSFSPNKIGCPVTMGSTGNTITCVIYLKADESVLASYSGTIAWAV